MAHAIFFEPPIETNFLGHQMAEIYKDKVYDSIFTGKKDLVVIDVGANLGMFTYYASRFAKEIYAVEPSVEHFDVLMKMLDYNKLENVHPINKAIYIKPGTYPGFKPPENRTMNSLHQGVTGGRPDVPFENWECITLPQLFADFSINHVDVMKLDIEGTETELICSTSFKEVAPKIDLIVLEQHAWSGRHPNQLLEGLRNSGFKDIQTIPTDANIIVARK